MFREKAKDGTTRLTGLSLNDIMLALNPVGTIYMSTDNTNPGTIFGGTWVAWGSGRVPVGVDTGQTEFDTVEETGGEKTHLLTSTEMPNHTHSYTGPHIYVSASGSAGGGTTDNAGDSVAQGATTGRFVHRIAIQAPSSLTGTGGGGAHNNLQPYITCYMWKRTA